MQTINVIMIGPAGVGKTTLLTTMYKELASVKTAGFHILATKETGTRMDDQWQEVHNEVLKHETFTPLRSVTKGTQGIIKHEFDVLFKSDTKFKLVFFDIAGGLVRDPDDKFEAQLEQSYIIINVIDGAALFNSFYKKGKETLSNDINRPTLVRDRLTPILAKGQPRIVLFVITKCEKWFNDSLKLQTAFKERHKEVLSLIEQNEAVTGIFIPVKTLGCFEFDRFDREDKMVFVRKPNLEFKPEDVDQPLRHALRFALEYHYLNRNWFKKVLDWLTGRGKDFEKSLNQFVEGCKKDYLIYPTNHNSRK